MTEEKCPQLVDYFVVAGLAGDSAPLDEECQQRGGRGMEPISDLAVIARGLGEDVPEGFTCIEKTLGGHPAELSAGLINNQHMFLCYRRSHDKPPIVELGYNVLPHTHTHLHALTMLLLGFLICITNATF